MHGLSFDLEDWDQNVRLRVTGEDAGVSRDFDAQVDHLLAICDEAKVRATFFVVGRLAQQVPGVVRDIANRGHEIGCHSNEHRLISSLDRATFVEDTRAAKSRLEDLTGMPVIGYRAPEFSVGSLRHWCFTVLRELGFQYDSSVFPVRGPRYGIADAPRWPFSLDTGAGRLVELPLLSIRLFGVNVPAAGGTYYRLLPHQTLLSAVGRAQRDGGTAILYFHPYEFTKKKLWLRDAGWRNLRASRHLVLHNFRTRRVAEQLRLILREYPFGTLDDVARASQASMERHAQ